MKRVLAGGVFNILHPGHIYFLKQARKLGDELIVILASDQTAKKAGKYLFPAKERKKLLEAVRWVDRVVIGYWPPDPERIIKRLKPDIIAVGYDQKINIKGVKIVKIKKYGKYSSKAVLGHHSASSSSSGHSSSGSSNQPISKHLLLI